MNENEQTKLLQMYNLLSGVRIPDHLKAKSLLLYNRGITTTGGMDLTAAIYTYRTHLFVRCSAYFHVYGHAVQRAQYGESVSADVVIIDQPWLDPPPAVDCKLLVIISAYVVECPPGSWFYRKPVDIDCMMDRILVFMEKCEEANKEGPAE